ncbi:MAG: AAA family ATPase [Actinomycetota bacterium]|nr:AAA family ATPase [Actinomycetota bacterium]
MTVEPEIDVREQGVIDMMARQQAIVEGLRPPPGSDDVATCLGWMAVRRQAQTYLRHLQPRLATTSVKGGVAPLSLSVAAQNLTRCLDEATLHLERFDETVRAQARPRLGLRLAVIGKGGAGKTFVSSTLARLLAQQGRQVLALDMDTNPGLSMSLGLPPIDAGLPMEAVEEHGGSMYGWRLAAGLSPTEAVDRFSVDAPDGVHFLGLGKVGAVDKLGSKRSVGALLHIALGFGRPDWDVIADLEAGPTTPFEGYHSFADDVVVVVGPAWRSAMTARRLLTLVGPRRTIMVANRFRDEPDHPGLTPLARIPFDPRVADAEGAGLPPLGACPDAAAIRAVDHFARRHLIEEVNA